jgi:hypothetical protein
VDSSTAGVNAANASKATAAAVLVETAAWYIPQGISLDLQKTLSLSAQAFVVAPKVEVPGKNGRQAQDHSRTDGYLLQSVRFADPLGQHLALIVL